MSSFADKHINTWVNTEIPDNIMDDPLTACQYADCVEEYQWAIQHWFHADVCVIEEISTSRRMPFFEVVLENWKKDDDGNPGFKITRMTLDSSEIVGMYRYYKALSDKK